MDSVIYTNKQLISDVHLLSIAIKKGKIKYNKIIGINRGGLIVGLYLGIFLDIENIIMIRTSTRYSFLSEDKCLFVSDLIRSGDTITKSCERNHIGCDKVDFACIHLFKNDKVKPKYYVQKYNHDIWIDYYWNLTPFPSQSTITR